MTTVKLTPEAARVILDAVVRTELSAAWQRGQDSAPNGVGGLADQGAPAAFNEIGTAVDEYAVAIVRQWREKNHDEH